MKKENDSQYCASCCKKIKKEAFICPYCGVKTKGQRNSASKIISFIICYFTTTLGFAFAFSEPITIDLGIPFANTVTILISASFIPLFTPFISYFTKRIILFIKETDNQAKIYEKMFCTSCGEVINKYTFICHHCGVKTKKERNEINKIDGALLVIFLRKYGAHKFYLKANTVAVLRTIFLALCYLTSMIGFAISIYNDNTALFLVSFIPFLTPSIIAFIEWIMLLCMSNDKFNEKYN